MEELKGYVESLVKLEGQGTVEALTERLNLLEKVQDVVRGLKVDSYVKRSYATASAEDALRDTELADKLQPCSNRVLLAKSVALSNLDRREEAKSALQQAAEAGKKASRSKIRQTEHVKDGQSELDPKQKSGPMLKPESGPEAEPEPGLKPKPSSAQAETEVKPRYEWSQDEKKLILTIFASNIDEKSSEIDVEAQELSVSLTRRNHPDFLLCLQLPHKVDEKTVQKTFSPSSVTVTLQKLEVFSAWKLPQDEDRGKRIRDWNKFVAPAKAAETSSDPLNQFFHKIYGEADDETRRAMNKSFVESGGKVLSTDWSEVKKGKVEYKETD
mmetsp:Transcript_8071/g.24317  ORF Transcript_8071/g.24317 Transcript_8071/m.24317 type:complete len:328 (-) Transcript_8071:257-1240(-)|eukprot:CAMPEP_0198729480 /NCGR_PEP_ID=MMETSP1475-20131203/18740_1 /TAXON_ID= ORGANISM="Unidentified sp., Strain CCMP1999" /NCGR_SAMPLE_ID=MMETSP1475 /ASSEMBLY_ACC=CAM_ASM_001111 /LENGTH=327 /DNA_ID=CAMNT_0044492143 /DNA_START=151 /DNA_END=1134 /DNA_ORIENTATION=+